MGTGYFFKGRVFLYFLWLALDFCAIRDEIKATWAGIYLQQSKNFLIE